MTKLKTVKKEMTINVRYVDTDDQLREAFDIREQVYIQEQQIERADEFDEYDDGAYHFLARVDGVAAGTCRYRQTENGIKLERFATLPKFRGKGVASKLMEAVIDDIKDRKLGGKLYLNAQLSAMSLYMKYGFEPEDDIFLECEIEHQKMSKPGLV